jgi:hypothetical protein
VGSAEHRIELLQDTNKPYASNHFLITRLTITSNKRVSIAGFGGFIDSSGYSAFTIGVKNAAPPQPTVFFDRVTLTNTNGINGGRLVENYGTLQLYGSTLTKGDVTGGQHQTGYGGAILNGPGAVISFAENSLITQNKAKRGGGLYNDAGIITELAVVISNNTAIEAGGGIFNLSTSPGPGSPTNGVITTVGLSLRDNTAPSGGGLFNRGQVDLTLSAITGNKALGTGSLETCPVSNGVDQPPVNMSCDGFGGGVLSVHKSGAPTRFQIATSSDFSNNSATGRGGAVFSCGVLELGGLTMNGNSAPNGAAVYVVGPTDGSGQYCHLYGSDDNGVGPMTVNGNTSGSTGYSIISGGSRDMRKCLIGGLAPPDPAPGYLTATGNSSPFCKPGTVEEDAPSRCPQ